MTMKTNPNWPVLTSYDQDHLARIALPLGGIGTGTVSLGGRGQLMDWEIVNRPAKGFTPNNTFFAVWAKPAGGEAVGRCAEGAIGQQCYEGSSGSQAANHGLPRFRNCSFAAAYPFGQVLLSDPDMPVDVRLEAFNPLIPADADSSGIPIAVLRYVLINKTDKTVAVSVCGSLQNFIGADSGKAGWIGQTDYGDAVKGNRNRFKKAKAVQGIFMTTTGTDPKAEQWGTMALTTTATAGVSYRTAWAQLSWGDTRLDFWDDLMADGRIDVRKRLKEPAPTGSLCVGLKLAPKATRAVTFLLSWHFPNRRTWTPKSIEQGDCCEGGCGSAGDTIGNYYATQYTDAFDVVVKAAPKLARLEAETIRFVEAFCNSDLPAAVKEAALYNVSTLRTQTCFRTADGLFYGWEGCHDNQGCCMGSCTHVWNYEQATAFLFGELACGMRTVEFDHATDDRGLMSFRTSLPLERACDLGAAAADGQMGCLMKLYRDWQLGGDDEMLRRLWPKAKKALEFCWIAGGWDADRDGVMEGCQHNTMDVEYYGPNPQMGTWYLGALRACEEMARYLGEDDFAETCRDLFERGSAWLDENLFNGEYYEHEIRPPRKAANIAEGLRWRMGADNLREPELQLGAACLVDQLVGQYMAHVCNLGYLLKPANVRKTLRSIMKYNFREDLFGHFNHFRTYALNDESAILMASYPHGRRPKRPFPYFNEVMTGFEYTAAVGMLQEGQVKAGLKCIRAVRDRYDGRKRSPFDEAECGHHYARAMASWAALTTLTGFRYSAVEGSITFAATESPSQVFWSNGYAWGTLRQNRHKRAGGGVAVELAVLGGSVTIRRLCLTGAGLVTMAKPKTLTSGRKLTLRVPGEVK